MTTDAFTDILDAAQQQKRDDATASLPRIVELEMQKKALEQEINILKGRVREVLDADQMPLVDGEHGIVASLKEVHTPASIDLATVSTQPHGEQYLAEAARALVLSAALTPLRALKGKGAWADALLRCEQPGGVRFDLKIEQTK